MVREMIAHPRMGSHARDHGLAAATAMLVAGPSSTHPDADHRIEFMRIAPPA